MPRPSLLRPSALALSLGIATAAHAAVVTEDVVDLGPAPITTALEALGPEVQVYNDHLTILASPFMEGRVPGSRGMELAREYMEYHFAASGLQAPFDGSYRQPFDLAGTAELTDQHLGVAGGPTFTALEDYTAMTSGGTGDLNLPVVFVGYSIDNGEDGYSSYDEGDDLTGKIALMFRFEPMNTNGMSKWSSSGGWSGRASFANKLRAAKERNAAGVIIVNTPGANDPRVESLPSARAGGGRVLDGPVMMMMPEAAEKLLAADPRAPSLLELREAADETRVVFELDARLTMRATIDRKPLVAENVGGLLPGKGALADELIVVGAHLDHLGMGDFGSRAEPGTLHPGADDNASGSAAVLMLGDRLARAYEQLPEGADARSVLFIGFDAEESGLNGSRYYANNPMRPMEDHAFMINFDMIGRITNNRLSVSGKNTAEGLDAWLQPYFEASPLEVVQPEALSGASDHTSFLQKNVPVLFGIIADFHDDYHTPRDVSWKINRVDAVKTVDLFEQITFGLGTRAERFSFMTRRRTETAGPAMGEIKVRFGISPGSYEDDEPGVAVGGVSDGTSAADADLREGDRLVSWNDESITDIRSWMGMLSKHDPGDKVKVGIVRDGAQMDVWVTLKARGSQ